MTVNFRTALTGLPQIYLQPCWPIFKLNNGVIHSPYINKEQHGIFMYRWEDLTVRERRLETSLGVDKKLKWNVFELF